jgi:hypothetical protein
MERATRKPSANRTKPCWGLSGLGDFEPSHRRCDAGDVKGGARGLHVAGGDRSPPFCWAPGTRPNGGLLDGMSALDWAIP